MINLQMRLIQNVKFPVSIMFEEGQTEGRPFDTFDVLTGALVEEVGDIYETKKTHKLSCGARVADPATGRVIFIQGYQNNAQLIADMKPGETVHLVGERRLFGSATQFNVWQELNDAPVIVNGRFAGTKTTPIADDESDEFVAPNPLVTEMVA